MTLPDTVLGTIIHCSIQTPSTSSDILKAVLLLLGNERGSEQDGCVKGAAGKGYRFQFHACLPPPDSMSYSTDNKKLNKRED